MGLYKTKWFCRWCGNPYTPQQQTERHGFCSTAHKQAHHRAYKSYVTAHQRSVAIAGQPVTQKKTAKKKSGLDLNGKKDPPVTQKRKARTRRGMIKT